MSGLSFYSVFIYLTKQKLFKHFYHILKLLYKEVFIVMNSEEAYYIKKLKILKNVVESKVDRTTRKKRKNFIGIASWNREQRYFKIFQVIKSSKHRMNHLEVECLDKIEELKRNVDIFYIFSKIAPCWSCIDILIQWTKSNRMNMIILGIEHSDSEFESNRIYFPDNLIVFDMLKNEMLKKEERRQNLNETFTKETFQELLSRVDRGFQRSAEKQKVLKPIINSPKPPVRVKMNNFVQVKGITEKDTEKEKLIIQKIMKKSKDDLFSTDG